MATKIIYANKRLNNIPDIDLVKGDRNSLVIRIIIPAIKDGVDLRPMAWCIKVENSAGEKDTHLPDGVEIREEQISIEWKPHGVATSVEGVTAYQLEGVESGGNVWQSGEMHIFVRDQIDGTPEDTQPLTDLQKLIIYVDGQLDGVIASGAAAQEAADNANKAREDLQASVDNGDFDGISPSVQVQEVVGGHRVTITDRDGDHSFDVLHGGGSAGGDMSASYYDTDRNGIVDNSERLGGKLPEEYAAADHNHDDDYADIDHIHEQYLTEEVDPTVPEWAKTEEKPEYTADEIKGLPAWAKTDSKPAYAASEISDIDAYIEQMFNRLNLEKNHPVGSLYMSENPTPPSTLFGGSWTQITDTFILAAGSAYPAGSIGGEAKHLLTLNEAPKHSHYPSGGSAWHFSVTKGGADDTGIGRKEMALDSSSGWWTVTTNGRDESMIYHKTDTQGGGVAHNNMPPYEAYYIWKRIA